MGSTERPIFVAKSVSKSKLSHYLATRSWWQEEEREESYGGQVLRGNYTVWSQSAGRQPANPLASSYRFLSPLLMKGKGR